MGNGDIKPLDGIRPRPFSAKASSINLVSVGLGAYLLLAVYPAYGFLRWYWVGEEAGFSFKGVGIAVVCAISFTVFARLIIRRYFHGVIVGR